jgi:hypothetical protein
MILLNSRRKGAVRARRKNIIIIAAVLCLILLFPITYSYKDGGTVEHKAIVYSVTNEHSLSRNADGENGFIVGTTVTIFGVVIYDNTHFEKQ